LASLLWLQEHAGRLGIDTTRIAVAGDSAGGNLGAVVTLKAHDTRVVAIACATLIYPGTGLDQDYPSYREHADGQGLIKASAVKYREMYPPRKADTEDAYASSVMAKDFSGLPPAWIHSAEINSIRDDGRILREQAGKSRRQCYVSGGQGNGPQFYGRLLQGRRCRQRIRLICRFLDKQLNPPA
jgi:acetyl esterase